MYKYIVRVFKENEIEEGLQKLLDENGKEGFFLNKLQQLAQKTDSSLTTRWLVILECTQIVEP